MVIIFLMVILVVMMVILAMMMMMTVVIIISYRSSGSIVMAKRNVTNHSKNYQIVNSCGMVHVLLTLLVYYLRV